MARGKAPKIGFGEEAARRSRMRELGFQHGQRGEERKYDDPEYRVSYRRGVEARERAVRAS